MKLNSYLIFLKKPTDQIEIVPEGFSFYAMMFSILWMIYHRMTYVILAVITLSLIKNIIFAYIDLPSLNSALSLIVSLGYGLFATDLRSFELQRCGYQLEKIILAYSPDEAKLKYLS